MNRAILVLSLCGVLNAAVGCSGSANDSGNPDGRAGGAGAAQAGSSSSAGAGNLAGSSSGGAASGEGGGAGAMSSGGSANNGGAGGLLVAPDPGSGSCMDFTPCGGDLLGTWQIDDLCTTPPIQSSAQNLIAQCPAVQETTRLVGTLSFFADGSLASDVHYVTHDEVPASCVSSLGGCGVQGGELAACSPGPDGSCTCDSPSPSDERTQYYVASGDHVLLTNLGEPAIMSRTAYYCQNGDRLFLRATNGTRIFVYQLTHQ